MTVVDALVKTQLATSKGQARRWINQWAVMVDGVQVVMDCEVAKGKHTIQVGKTRSAEFEY